MTRSRTVAILALPGVQLLDVSGPLDVFAEANVQARREEYRLLIVASTAGEIRSSSGTRLVPDLAIGAPPREPIHTLRRRMPERRGDVPRARRHELAAPGRTRDAGIWLGLRGRVF